MRMDPLDALEKAVSCATLDGGRRHKNVPGVVIQRLPDEIREALARLTSDEASSDRLASRMMGLPKEGA